MKSVRPASLPPGRVWSRFYVEGRDGKAGQWFTIRDVDVAEKEELLDEMISSFLNYETLSIALGVDKDVQSKSQIRYNWGKDIDIGLSLCCVAEECGRAAAAALCGLLRHGVDSDDAIFHRATAQPWRKLLTTLSTVDSTVDVLSHYAVDSCLTLDVLTVMPEYRGLGLAKEMFNAVESLARALNQPVISTICTAMASQAIATSAGYDTLSTFHYDKMADKGIDLSNSNTNKAIVFGKRLK